MTKRPGQSRGVTWFAPVMVSIRMLEGYQEAELVAARAGASKMGFFESSPVIGYSVPGVMNHGGELGPLLDSSFLQRQRTLLPQLRSDPKIGRPFVEGPGRGDEVPDQTW